MDDNDSKPTVIDPAAIAPRLGSAYPAPYTAVVEGREKHVLGDEVGLTQFGVNLTRLKPGAVSALRHWHEHEDEFVYVLEGEITLVTDSGAQILSPGAAAGFPAGRADGHHLVNRGAADAVYLEIGGRHPNEQAHYPDDDLHLRIVDGKPRFFHKDGTPY